MPTLPDILPHYLFASFGHPNILVKLNLLPFPEEVCTLIITEAFPEDSGEFKCIAENEAGTAISAARLFVSPGNYSSVLPAPIAL